jgi:hypothetical protein
MNMLEIMIDIAGVIAGILLMTIVCLIGAITIVALGKALISLIKDKDTWEDYF